jgi:hypothetical protein
MIATVATADEPLARGAHTSGCDASIDHVRRRVGSWRWRGAWCWTFGENVDSTTTTAREDDVIDHPRAPPHTVRIGYVDCDAWEYQAGRLVVQWCQNEATGGSGLAACVSEIQPGRLAFPTSLQSRKNPTLRTAVVTARST